MLNRLERLIKTGDCEFGCAQNPFEIIRNGTPGEFEVPFQNPSEFGENQGVHEATALSASTCNQPFGHD